MSAETNDARTREANSPAAAVIGTARRWTLMAAMAMLAVVLLPAAGYVVYDTLKPPTDDIESVIRQYGFDPLTPPNQLRGPGALYKAAGTSYQVVCPADPALLEGRLQKSPTPDRVRTRLESANLSLGGDYVRELNGKVAGARATLVEYRMKDVAISEIAMSHLLAIQNALLQDPACDKTVHDLLQRNEKVCAGYAALSATTFYKIHYDSSLASNAAAKQPLLDALREKIEADAGSQIRVQSEDELSGDNLYYGIQLWELCITPDTATESSPLSTAPRAGGAEVF